MHPFYERLHGFALGFSPGVGRLAVGVETALVADADRVGVMSFAVCPYLFNRSSFVHGAVAGDIKVISYIPEVSVHYMVAPALLKAQAPPIGSRRAVNDDKSNCSHRNNMFTYNSVIRKPQPQPTAH